VIEKKIALIRKGELWRIGECISESRAAELGKLRGKYVHKIVITKKGYTFIDWALDSTYKRYCVLAQG